jgi:uncharacterized DUF497 family protein
MLTISSRVRQKLADKHGVDKDDILDCFANRENVFLTDVREENQTNPPTKWFISQCNNGRYLKVVFMQDDITGDVAIKTAYEPNPEELRIYGKFAKKI